MDREADKRGDCMECGSSAPLHYSACSLAMAGDDVPIPKMIKPESMGPTEQDVTEAQIGHPVVFPKRSEFVLQHKDASHLPDSDSLKTDDSWLKIKMGPQEEPTVVLEMELMTEIHLPVSSLLEATGETIAQLCGERFVGDMEEDFMPILAERMQKFMDERQIKPPSTRVGDTEPGFDEKDPRATL